MSRELTEKLITRKQALNKEKFELDEELSNLPSEHLWVINTDTPNDSLDLTSQELETKQKHFALNNRKLEVQTLIDRAHLYGQRHTSGAHPSLCLNCFIDHDIKALMVEKQEPNLGGDRLFVCEKCECSLRIATVIG